MATNDSSLTRLHMHSHIIHRNTQELLELLKPCTNIQKTHKHTTLHYHVVKVIVCTYFDVSTDSNRKISSGKTRRSLSLLVICRWTATRLDRYCSGSTAMHRRMMWGNRGWMYWSGGCRVSGARSCGAARGRGWSRNWNTLKGRELDSFWCCRKWHRILCMLLANWAFVTTAATAAMAYLVGVISFAWHHHGSKDRSGGVLCTMMSSRVVDRMLRCIRAKIGFKGLDFVIWGWASVFSWLDRYFPKKIYGCVAYWIDIQIHFYRCRMERRQVVHLKCMPAV